MVRLGEAGDGAAVGRVGVAGALAWGAAIAPGEIAVNMGVGPP